MDFLKRKIKENKFWLLCLGIVSTIGDIAFFQSTDNLPLLIVVFFWLFLVWVYKLSEKIFFVMAIIFLIPVPIFLIFGNQVLSEKFAAWEFIFISLGLFWWIVKEAADFSKRLKVRRKK